MQGKSKLPKIEMEFRRTARAILKKLDFEQEREALLSISDQGDARSQEVIEVAEMRMALAEEIKLVLDKLVAAKNKEEQARLKEAQKNLMEEFMSLPELGSTFDEWMEAINKGIVKKSAGRPPIPFEVNLIRAQELAKKSMASYIDLSNQLGNPVSIDDPSLHHPLNEKDMLNLYSKVTANMGKESHDELGVIDAEVRKLDARINYIKSGEAERERDEKLRKAKYSSKGTRLGRPFEPLEDILARLESEKESLEEKKERLEAKLPVVDMIARRIKVTEDQMRDVRASIRKQGWDPRKDSRKDMPYGDILTELEDRVSQYKEAKRKAEQGADAANKRKAERAVERLLVMEEEVNRQNDRDQDIRKKMNPKGKLNHLQEGVDDLVKEISESF